MREASLSVPLGFTLAQLLYCETWLLRITDADVYWALVLSCSLCSYLSASSSCPTCKILIGMNRNHTYQRESTAKHCNSRIDRKYASNLPPITDSFDSTALSQPFESRISLDYDSVMSTRSVPKASLWSPEKPPFGMKPMTDMTAMASSHYPPKEYQAFQCPLDWGNHEISPSTSLGDLARLPLELQQDILGYIDLKSLLEFRRVNQRAMEVVNSIVAFDRVIRHCP